MKIEIKILDKEFYRDYENETGYPRIDYCLPKFATRDSAGIDLILTESIILYPDECHVTKTGLAIHINSESVYLQDTRVAGVIVPRSGLGSQGLILANTVGIIDGDYQGEILVNLWNRSKTGRIELFKGERYAQLLFVPVITPTFKIVDEFSKDTQRGLGGFGSTGLM